MGANTPGQTPEGRLIEEAAKATGRSVRALAANAGISDTHWRHLVKGWRPTPNGPLETKISALTLARMAAVVDVSSEALAEAGRQDAANVLPKVLHQRVVSAEGALYLPAMQVTAHAGVAGASATAFDARVETVDGRPFPDEIDMIYASNTMTAREKLIRIRQVLQLRAQVEAELQEMASGETENAPTMKVEASDGNHPEAQS